MEEDEHLTEAAVKETVFNVESLKKSSTARNKTSGKSSSRKPQACPKNHKPEDFAVMSTRRYLDATIVPSLSRAMVALGRERPGDPIQFLANFLKKNVQYSQTTDPDTPTS